MHLLSLTVVATSCAPFSNCRVCDFWCPPGCSNVFRQDQMTHLFADLGAQITLDRAIGVSLDELMPPPNVNEAGNTNTSPSQPVGKPKSVGSLFGGFLKFPGASSSSAAVPSPAPRATRAVLGRFAQHQQQTLSPGCKGGRSGGSSGGAGRTSGSADRGTSPQSGQAGGKARGRPKNDLIQKCKDPSVWDWPRRVLAADSFISSFAFGPGFFKFADAGLAFV